LIKTAELKKLLTNHQTKWMIWKGAPIKFSVDILKVMGIQSAVFDPCGNVPTEGDFLSVMQQNVNNLEPLFR
jgi:zinc transport system substrate-binding protein